MKKESTEVAVVQSNEVVATTVDAEWGTNDQFSAADLVISKVLLAQGLSQIVTDEKAKLGEMYINTTEQVIGGFDKPINVIPFYVDKIWIVSTVKETKGKKKEEFKKIVPVTPANENLPWNDIEDGEVISRKYIRNVYCLLESDPKMCYIIPFKGTSAKSGKALMTQMYSTNRLGGKSPAGMVVEIASRKETNDDGTFAVLNTRPIKATPVELEKSALEWFKLVKKGAVKVDDSDIKASQSNEDNVPF